MNVEYRITAKTLPQGRRKPVDRDLRPKDADTARWWLAVLHDDPSTTDVVLHRRAATGEWEATDDTRRELALSERCQSTPLDGRAGDARRD